MLRPLLQEIPVYSLEELVAQITPENLHPEIDWGAPDSVMVEVLAKIRTLIQIP